MLRYLLNPKSLLKFCMRIKTKSVEFGPNSRFYFNYCEQNIGVISKFSDRKTICLFGNFWTISITVT